MRVCSRAARILYSCSVNVLVHKSTYSAHRLFYLSVRVPCARVLVHKLRYINDKRVLVSFVFCSTQKYLVWTPPRKEALFLGALLSLCVSMVGRRAGAPPRRLLLLLLAALALRRCGGDDASARGRTGAQTEAKTRDALLAELSAAALDAERAVGRGQGRGKGRGQGAAQLLGQNLNRNFARSLGRDTSMNLGKGRADSEGKAAAESQQELAALVHTDQGPSLGKAAGAEHGTR